MITIGDTTRVQASQTANEMATVIEGALYLLSELTILCPCEHLDVKFKAMRARHTNME